jgi:hypothetical protein
LKVAINEMSECGMQTLGLVPPKRGLGV